MFSKLLDNIAKALYMLMRLKVVEKLLNVLLIASIIYGAFAIISLDMMWYAKLLEKPFSLTKMVSLLIIVSLILYCVPE